MKQIITEADIPSMIGKFAVQLNEEHVGPDLSSTFKKDYYFWLEKRIFFIGILHDSIGMPHIKTKEPLIIRNGFYYTHGIQPKLEFIEYWNHYLASASRQRYHRLLHPNELDWLLTHLKIN